MVAPNAIALAVAFVATVGLGACSVVAGLGDYSLAPSDASASDGTVEDAPAGDAEVEASPPPAGDAGGDGPEPDGSSVGNHDSAAPAADASPDASEGDGPAVPPSDRTHVTCSKDTCGIPFEICCEEPDGATCQAAMAGCNGGVVAHCDEAANCPPSWVCCVTGESALGLAMECRTSCQGTVAQSCRTNAECAAGTGQCVGWSCAGSVVATCGGAGASAACH